VSRAQWLDMLAHREFPTQPGRARHPTTVLGEPSRKVVIAFLAFKIAMPTGCTIGRPRPNRLACEDPKPCKNLYIEMSR
jgi:hypothetical protein